MPRPITFFCAENSSEDKQSGLLSAFNIIDNISFKRGTAADFSLMPPFKMRMIAVWMREDSDSDEQTHESEFSFLLPVSNKEVVVGTIEFTFPKGKQFYRTIGMLDGPLPIDGTGVMTVQAKLRVKGTGDWIVQSYPIVITEIPTEKSDTNSK